MWIGRRSILNRWLLLPALNFHVKNFVLNRRLGIRIRMRGPNRVFSRHLLALNTLTGINLLEFVLLERRPLLIRIKVFGRWLLIIIPRRLLIWRIMCLRSLVWFLLTVLLLFLLLLVKLLDVLWRLFLYGVFVLAHSLRWGGSFHRFLLRHMFSALSRTLLFMLESLILSCIWIQSKRVF